MGILNKIMLATAVCGSCVSGMAAEKAAEKAAVHPSRIALLITDVGSIDTVAKTEDFLGQIKKVSNAEMPGLSAADRAAATPAMEREIVRINWNTRKAEYIRDRQMVEDENRRMANVLYQLRNSVLVGNKRHMVLGKNYLQSYLQKYSKFIQIIDRSNTNIAEVEKAIGNKDQVDVAGSMVFLTVIIGDMEETTSTVPVGNTMVTRKNYSLKMVANLRDYNGNVLFATDVIAKKSYRFTNVTSVKGINFNDDLMEDGWKQIADKVGAYFIAELKFKAKGPKGDDSFDADDVTVCVDGKEVDGESCKVLAYNHTITAECEGCQSIERKVEIKAGETSGAKTVKLNFKKAKNNRKF